MSREERQNPGNFFKGSSRKKKGNIVITITIPTAIIIALIGVYYQFRKEKPGCDFKLYLAHTDQFLSERMKALPDTSSQYMNLKFVLDFKRNTIDPFNDESLRKLAPSLQNDLLRVATERAVDLPQPCSQ